MKHDLGETGVSVSVVSIGFGFMWYDIDYN
jgi:hypothetical protein